ncbi:nuclear pore complex protein Nup75 [Brevipalpus obovatus]|uniref:nuclear pore complex protein Nup75 n=1 Tax=Brevipalpus obovatus TaxID=246614 RepID=UPI003D9F4AB0
MSVYPVTYQYPILRNQVLREFVAEAACVFKNIQSAALEDISREEIIKASHHYRAVLHSNLLKFDENPTSEPSRELLRNMSLLWHLCEIVFLDSSPREYLTDQLLVWIRWHHPEPLIERIIGKSEPHLDDDYWLAVYKLASRGEVKSATFLLKQHPEFKEEGDFAQIVNLIGKMPQFSKDYVLYEFSMKWEAWSSQCQFHMKTYSYSPEVQTLLGLLSGNLKTFFENKHFFSTWYELMVALLLYADPLIKETDVASFSKECYHRMRGEQHSHPSHFDGAILSVFASDSITLFHEACFSLDDNSWFAAHLIDLFYHDEILGSDDQKELEKMREYFLLDYGDVLMRDSELWEVGVAYLESSPSFGLESLRMNLLQILLDTEAKAEKVMNFAQMFNFEDVFRSAALVKARQFLSKNQIGQALLWAAKSKSSVLTSHISDLFLKEYIAKRKFPDENVLSSLKSLIINCDRLTFLVEYHKFISLKEKKMFEEAAILLENLISSRIAPKFFVLTLLMEAMPLLEARKLILNREQTIQILAALEDSYDSVSSEMMDELKEKGRYLSLAIARNMARTTTCTRN